MATILPILTDDNPLLRKTTKEIKNFTPEINQLIQQMYYTLKHHNAMGLAAPQIGSDYSICIIRSHESAPIIMINPKIRKKSELKQKISESCLSCPNKEVEVDRSMSIIIEYTDEHGQHCINYLRDLSAIIAQHEIDHLNGILITDYLH